MRATALFPMACAIVAFVLGMLCIFAGHKPGFMEEYNIITLNTSTLGYAALNTSTATTTSSSSSATPTSFTGWLTGITKNITGEIEGEFTDIENELNKLEGEVANELASLLGIHEWYSFHIMDFCEGSYKPNATSKNASKNITSCTNSTAMHKLDISTLVSAELAIGRYNISLSDIGWSNDIQKDLNDLDAAMDALFVFYAIGIAAAGLAIIASFIALFLSGSRFVSFGNWGLACLSFICFLVSSIIITIVQDKATHELNKYGNEIGLFAYKGKKYLIITWVSVAVMFLATCAWVVEFCIGRKNKRREYTEKSASGGSWYDRRKRSDEAALRRSGV